MQLRTAKAGARHASTAEVVYADAPGMTLYVYSKDAPGVSNCAGDCLSLRPPAVAPAGAKPIEDWAVTLRADGTRQWAYRGAPLYRFKQDAAVGDAKGDSDVWHAAEFRPGTGVVLRAGIAAREIDDAGGEGLVDHLGLTVYMFDGDAAHPPKCASENCTRHWIPLRAADIAMAAGQFSIISRDDGINQWAYRGKPLFTFDGDAKPLEVHGIGVDPRFQAALIRRFYMPADATIRRIIPLGDVLATLSGATLYQRDRALTDDEGHNFREDHGSPALGRSFATATCDAKCAVTWRPFVAPPGALPSGFWDILIRADRVRQWAYKGFALYTYVGDKAGDVNGNEIYDLVQVRDTATATDSAPGSERQDPGIPPRIGTGLGALFWHAVVP